MQALNEDRGDEEEYGMELKAELDKLENSLMHTEMSLQQVLNAGTETFVDRVNLNVKQCKEHGNAFFEEAGMYIEQYNMDLKQFALEAHEKLLQSYEARGAEEEAVDLENEDEVSQDSQEQRKEELLAEKETVVTKLDASAEFLVKELSEVDKACMGRIESEVKAKITQFRTE